MQIIHARAVPKSRMLDLIRQCLTNKHLHPFQARMVPTGNRQQRLVLIEPRHGVDVHVEMSRISVTKPEMVAGRGRGSSCLGQWRIYKVVMQSFAV